MPPPRHGVRPCGARRTSAPDPTDVVAASKVRTGGRRVSSAPGQGDVAEDDRNSQELLTAVRAVLNLEVQMRWQRVSRVPDRGDVSTAPHTLAQSQPHASLLKVRQYGITPVADVEDEVIALTGRLSDRTDGIVGLPIERADDRAIGRSENRFSVTVPGGRPVRIAAVAAPVDCGPPLKMTTKTPFSMTMRNGHSGRGSSSRWRLGRHGGATGRLDDGFGVVTVPPGCGRARTRQGRNLSPAGSVPAG